MRRLRPSPVLADLVHRRRRPWSRLCVCGLRWSRCPDRHRPPEPAEPAPALPSNPGAHWNAPTGEVETVGRAGRMTLAGTFRANGGRW